MQLLNGVFFHCHVRFRGLCEAWTCMVSVHNRNILGFRGRYGHLITNSIIAVFDMGTPPRNPGE